MIPLDYSTLPNQRRRRSILFPTISVTVLHIVASTLTALFLSPICFSPESRRGLMTLTWGPGCALNNIRPQNAVIFVVGAAFMFAGSVLVGLAWALLRHDQLFGFTIAPIRSRARTLILLLGFFPFPVPTYMSLLHLLSY